MVAWHEGIISKKEIVVLLCSINLKEIVFFHPWLQSSLLNMVALDGVDKLSDDEAVAASAKPAPSSSDSPKKGAPKAKAKGKAKTSPKKVSKDAKPEPKAVPKVEKKKSALKRPASSSTKEPSIKRPAGSRRDPDHISTSKSMYKNGVYCIKLFGKQALTVPSLHWCFVQSKRNKVQTPHMNYVVRVSQFAMKFQSRCRSSRILISVPKTWMLLLCFGLS
jgi:hypothetical protein